MADFTLNAPGTTNNPWTPAGVLVPVGGSTFGIKSDATGWRAITAGNVAVYAHNVTYGTTITTTETIAAGATSNGDQMYVGAVVRSGANAGAGIGVLIDAFVCACGWWDVTGNTFTKVSSSDTAITRANSDVWSVTVTISGGTASITCTQNGSAITFTGSHTTTQWATEASLAAGAALTAGNNDSLYLSQMTGTGVAAGTFTLTAAAGSYAMTGQAATVYGGYVLTAGGGTYAITGEAATLSPSGGSFTLVAAAGVYNLIGASSSSAFQLDAAAGVYVLTGEAAILSPTGIFTLTADFGSYSLAGQAVTFTTGTSVAYSLIAAPGFYSLSGIPATLLVSTIVPVTPACVTNFEIIADAYQLIGVIDENSAPSNEQGVTALSVLNDYLLNEAADGMRLGWFRQSILQACTPLKDEDVYGVKILLALQLAARYGITIQNQQLLEAGIVAKTQLVKRALRYSEADFSEFPRPQGGPWGGPNWI